VAELTAGRTEAALGPGGDWRFQASLERLLEIIGEAANRVPKDVQAQFPQIPWSAISSGGQMDRLAKRFSI